MEVSGQLYSAALPPYPLGYKLPLCTV